MTGGVKRCAVVLGNRKPRVVVVLPAPWQRSSLALSAHVTSLGPHLEAKLDRPVCLQVVAGPRNHAKAPEDSNGISEGLVFFCRPLSLKT